MPTPCRVLHLFALPATLVAATWLAGTAAAAPLRPVAEPATPAAVGHVLSVRAGDGDVQAALAHSPAWRAFTARNGNWKALWNEATSTPHRAWGPSIALPGFANDATSAERAVRAFIAGHPALFGGPGVQLATRASVRHGDVWYVRFQQTVNGLPVLYSDWEFRVGTNGRLMMFGVDARDPAGAPPASVRIPGTLARQAALRAAFDPANDRVELSSALAYVPVASAGGATGLRLAYPAVVRSARPGRSVDVLVDANTGDVLSAERSAADVTGTVTAQIHASTPYDTLKVRPLADARVDAVTGTATVSAVTDTFGHYSVTPNPVGSCTIKSTFIGPYATVVRMDNPGANFSKSGVASGATQNIAWTTSNSQDSERDAFYHTNLAHDWMKAIDPTFTAIDYSLLVNVNINDGVDCEADWDQPSNSLNFWLVGACPNTATIPDMVWHEYAHMTNWNLYFSNGVSQGLQNGALGEGIADAFTVLLGDEPLVGNGFNGPGTFLRDVRVGARYPEDLSPDKHVSGSILAGALWDLRNATTNALASKLMHFARYGLPDDPDAGIALSEYFVDVLVADDDDADLSDGTPNFNAINTAFSVHGIGMNYFLSVGHTPLDDQPGNGPYPIDATIVYGGPIGSLGSAKMFYSINNTPYVSATMLPTGNPDEYGAEIPATSYGIVRYYLVTTDSYGGTQTLPAGAPALGTYTYVAGQANTLAFDDMENPDGWTVGYAPDTPVATTGTWIRAVPVGSLAQPYSNHTPGGSTCWVTGNANAGDPPGANDIDFGKTTLVTSTFNATPPNMVNPIISYWRWFSNNTGDNPLEDPWRVYISNNNGSTWKLVENTLHGATSWRRIVFAIKDYVPPTATMKMRFVAQDTLNPSLVEAAVDDWELFGFSGTLGVTPQGPAAELALKPVWPNPSHGATHVSYSLPTASDVELAIYDLEGRRVRTLFNGIGEPGAHSLNWDGRDAAGRTVAVGPYFVRLTRSGTVISRAVVLLR